MRPVLCGFSLVVALASCDSGQHSQLPEGSAGAGLGGSPAGGAPSTSGTGGASGGSAAIPGGSGGSGGTAGSMAGAAAAGTAGASGGADSGSCAGATVFCEDFEALALGSAQKSGAWEPVTSGGTLTIDAVHARGGKALHVHAEENGHAYISVNPFTPPNNSFFARMYAWVEAFPTAPNYAHYTLVEAAGTPAGLIRPIGGQYIEGDGNLWGPGSDGGPTGDWTNWQISAPAQAGKWLCIEFELAAADNAIRIWIDGTAKPDLSVSTKNHGGSADDFVFPTFSKIWFGWWLYQSGPTPNAFDVWLDDIAIGTTRLGC